MSLVSPPFQFLRGPLSQLPYIGNLADGEPAAITVTGVSYASTPLAPTLTSTAGGTLAATTYYVVVTYTNNNGETTASPSSSLAVEADYLLEVFSPNSVQGAQAWNVYASTSSGGPYYLQTSSPIGIGTNWTEPTSGLLTSGNTPPATNTTDAVCPLLLLYVGGHNSTGNLILGGGFQITSGEPSFTAPAGAAMYDSSTHLLWISNGDGTWTSK